MGLTVAQLQPEVKNRISHRSRAIDKFIEAYRQEVFKE
jgi:inosine/xanthosine triphosphate pyrophosphatase family protein